MQSNENNSILLSQCGLSTALKVVLDYYYKRFSQSVHNICTERIYDSDQKNWLRITRNSFWLIWLLKPFDTFTSYMSILFTKASHNETLPKKWEDFILSIKLHIIQSIIYALSFLTFIYVIAIQVLRLITAVEDNLEVERISFQASFTRILTRTTFCSCWLFLVNDHPNLDVHFWFLEITLLIRLNLIAAFERSTYDGFFNFENNKSKNMLL